MDAEKFWDNAAEKYAKSKIGNEEVYQEKLKTTQEYLTQDFAVLEIGCGTGTTAIHHAPHVRSILGTDISMNMIEIARGRAKEAGVENARFEQATVDDIDAEPASFDAVLALNIIHLLDDPAAAIKKVSNLLKPGGIFVSSTVCLGDRIISLWRIMIPVMRLLGKAPPVKYLKRHELERYLTDAGFKIEMQRPPAKGEAAFIVAKKH